MESSEIADKIRTRVGGFAGQASFGAAYVGNAEYWADIAAELRSTQAST